MDIEYIKQWRSRNEESPKETYRNLEVKAWRSSKVDYFKDIINRKIALRQKGLAFVNELIDLEQTCGDVKNLLEFFRNEAELQLQDLEASKRGLKDKHANDVPLDVGIDWSDSDTADPDKLANFLDCDVEEE
jgi:hypothetical protein